MSYISAWRNKDMVFVWERNEAGKRVLKKYPAPFDFYTEDPNGEYTSIFGQKLTLNEFDTFDDFNEAKDFCKKRDMLMYESDIGPELKVLSRHYNEAPIPKLHITFFDIEVDYQKELGFSSVKNPYAPVSAIAFQHYWKDESVVFVVPPKDWDATTFDNSLHDLAKIVFCKTEKELLRRFLDEIEDSDVLCGWNSDMFDIPYMCKRIEMVLGKESLKRMNFPEAKVLPRFRDVEMFGKISTTADLTGRIKVDYMELFKKYEMEKRASYKLEYISEEILPHLKKLDYEGSLYDLYRNDFNHFVRYNIRDAEILKGFEDKLGYVNVANVMYHMSTGLMNHVFGTIRLADLAMVNYCHYTLNVKVPDWVAKDDGSIKGALVLYPQIGLRRWVGSVDITSLYPSAIRSVNISPETIVGQFTTKTKAWDAMYDMTDEVLILEYENGDMEERTAVEWREYLLEKRWSVSGYGTVFDQNQQGVVPALLTAWFGLRKKYQALKNEHGENAEKILGDRKEDDLKGEERAQYDHEIERKTYYDKLQYVYKIKLNSFYGALTNYNFRFFDLRMGESTTATGRMISRHQIRKIGQTLDGKYDFDFPLYGTVADALEKGEDPRLALNGPLFNGKFQSESIVYGDTDSCYFSTGTDNFDDAVSVADGVAVIVNKSFPAFMRKAFLCSEGYDTLVKAGREVVSDAGIFVDKKRYVLHLVDLDGKKVDKLKVMGLEMRKTTTPKPIQKFLKEVVTRVLRGDDWEEIDDYILKQKRTVANKMDLMDIGLPKGITGVEEYTPMFEENLKNWGPADSKNKVSKQARAGKPAKHRIPGHVTAAIHYNKMLNEYEDKESMPIVSDMKIKVFYLKTPVNGFKNIALPTDLEFVPSWFMEHFNHIVDRSLHSEKLVDANLAHIFNAIDREVPTFQSKFFDSMVEW